MSRRYCDFPPRPTRVPAPLGYLLTRSSSALPSEDLDRPSVAKKRHSRYCRQGPAYDGCRRHSDRPPAAGSKTDGQGIPEKQSE